MDPDIVKLFCEAQPVNEGTFCQTSALFSTGLPGRRERPLNNPGDKITAGESLRRVLPLI